MLYFQAVELQSLWRKPHHWILHSTLEFRYTDVGRVRVVLIPPRRDIPTEAQYFTICQKCGGKAYPPYVVAYLGRRVGEAREFRLHTHCMDYVKDPRVAELAQKVQKFLEVA